MKKTLLHSALLLDLLVTFLLCPLVACVQHTSFAQGPPTIYVQPFENVFYTNQTFVGDRFNLTVWIQDAPPIGAWQVHMEFNDSVINVTRWFEPRADPQYIFYGKDTSVSFPDPGYVHIGPNTAKIEVATYLLPAPPIQEPASGNGKLCMLEFVIIRHPTSVGDTISSTLNITSVDTFLLSPHGDVIDPAKQDGSFDYVVGAVPTLRLVGSPQFIQFTPYQDMTDDSFNTTVSVSGPASEADLTNVSFTLSYDPSLFSTSESNVLLNSTWAGSHSISVGTGQIIVSVSAPSSLPSEPTVVICIIEFTVQKQQTVPPQPLGDNIDTGINFTSSTLLNSVGNAINQISPSNQTVRIYAYQTEAGVLTITQPAITSTGITIQNNTLFAVNVSMTDVYNPSIIQIKLLYEQSVIICIGVIPIGEVASDDLACNISQPGLAIAKVSISGHTNPIVSGPIFQFEFRAVTENATSYLNFSKPYGQDTVIQDSSGAIANATYLETTVHISETPRPHLVLESSQTRLNTTVKTQCSFELTVKNEGNVEAKNVSLSSYGVLSSWVQFSEDGFSLALDSMKNVNVTVTPTYTGEFNLTIAVASTEGSTANATLTLSISESAANPPWELIVPAIIIGIGIVATITLMTVKSRRRKKTRLVRT